MPDTTRDLSDRLVQSAMDVGYSEALRDVLTLAKATCPADVSLRVTLLTAELLETRSGVRIMVQGGDAVGVVG